MITKKQFDVLVYFAQNENKPTQREVAAETGMALGTANKVIAELEALGYVEDKKISQAGLEMLENNYRAKRAVFIAAGFGSRLVPITLNTPKPLVRVKGVRMIESLLDAVVAAGIEEIYIVRGYLGEQFDQLLYKYPTIKFIENPAYNEANNISSAYCARYLLQNAYVFEADLMLYNPKLITRYQYSSNYLGVPVETTDDWCFETDGDRIIRCGIGGTNCHHMYGISYWTKEDGIKLASDIEKVFFMPGGKQRFWDLVPLEFCLDNYNVSIRECTFDDVVEIDTYNELKVIDKTYDV